MALIEVEDATNGEKYLMSGGLHSEGLLGQGGDIKASK